MTDTGYSAAIEWLEANHPDLRLSSAQTRLVAGPTAGSRTRQVVSVTLVPKPVITERQGIVFEERGDYWLSAEAPTILSAVKRAVGAFG